MQISGISTSPSVPMEGKSSSRTDQAASDQAVLNVSSDSFLSLVHEAGQMPEVRSEVVDAYKARIQSGAYPAPEVVSGLVDVIGASVVQLAKVD